MLNNKTILITGGTGSFGTRFISIILKKYPNWKANVIGDEQRDKIIFNHKNLINYGFLRHNKVLDIYKKTSINKTQPL